MNVALPAIQREIGGSLADLQWVIDAYTPPWPGSPSGAGSKVERVALGPLVRDD